jgi:hypothetical protein
MRRQILVEKLEGKRSLGRSRRRWENNVEWILGKYCGKGWTGCIWLRIETTGLPL